jgi:hypothetical protein
MAGPAAVELGDKFLRYHIDPVDRAEQAKMLETHLQGHPVVSTDGKDTRNVLLPEALDMRVFRGIYHPVYIVAPNETIREMKVMRLTFDQWDYSVSFPLPGGGEGSMNWRYHETGLHMPFQTVHGPLTDIPYVATDDRPVNVWRPENTNNTPEQFSVLFLRCGVQVGEDVFQCLTVHEAV